MAWPTIRRSLVATTLVALALALPGCKKPADPPISPPTPTKPTARVTLIVHSEKHSNRGRPVHLVVRVVTRKSFVEDEYSKIARLVVEPDETVIQTFVVLPGENQVVPLTFTDEPEALGVYGLFTRATGESWKMLAERPGQIEVWLGESALERPRIVERKAQKSK